MSQINRATVTFLVPPGGSRKADTETQLLVKSVNGSSLASGQNLAEGVQMQPGAYGPYELLVQEPNSTANDFEGGTTILNIAPTGQDQFIANAIVTLYWNNGEIETCQSHPVILTQQRNVAMWENRQGNVTLFHSQPQAQGEQEYSQMTGRRSQGQAAS